MRNNVVVVFTQSGTILKVIGPVSQDTAYILVKGYKDMGTEAVGYSLTAP